MKLSPARYFGGRPKTSCYTVYVDELPTQRALSIEISMPNEANSPIQILINNTVGRDPARQPKGTGAGSPSDGSERANALRYSTYKEVGEGHDKGHGKGWEEVEPWIKIHPPSPAALRILIAGSLAEDSVGGPMHANRGRTCRVFKGGTATDWLK